MKEVVYTFHPRGCYLPDTAAVFADGDPLRLVIRPHEFSLTLSGESLRSSACPGYIIQVSPKGATQVCNGEGRLLAETDDGDTVYKEVRFSWTPTALTVQFGRVTYVDNYPHCDGEHDRWEEKWLSMRTVTVHTETYAVTVL